MQQLEQEEGGRRANSNNNNSSKKAGRVPRHDIDHNTESFRNFVRRFRNSAVTKTDYVNNLRRFIHFCNLVETKARIKVDIGNPAKTDLLLFDGDTKKIQNTIKHYIDYQYDRGISPVTMKSHYNALKHFYDSNEIQLNWSLIRKDYVGITNIKANVDMPYTYEEIHKMLDKADERMRVVIFLLASTGMRRGAIHELKVGDLKWIDQYRIYEVTVYRGFSEEYKTFCSLECASAINSYLDFRRRYGEQITSESYLIRKQFNRTSNLTHTPIRPRGSDPNDPPEKHKVTDSVIQVLLYNLVYAAGIRTQEGKVKRKGDRHKNMVAHSYRKFFENKCLEAGIDPFYVSVLMGHKAGIGVERHYYRPSAINGENSLLELYVKKAMPYLTISDESRLKLKNRELEMRIQEQNEMNKRIEDLKKEFEVREDLLRKVMDERIARALDAREKAKEK
jgi:integrase